MDDAARPWTVRVVCVRRSVVVPLSRDSANALNAGSPENACESTWSWGLSDPPALSLPWLPRQARQRVPDTLVERHRETVVAHWRPDGARRRKPHAPLHAASNALVGSPPVSDAGPGRKRPPVALWTVPPFEPLDVADGGDGHVSPSFFCGSSPSESRRCWSRPAVSSRRARTSGPLSTASHRIAVSSRGDSGPDSPFRAECGTGSRAAMSAWCGELSQPDENALRVEIAGLTYPTAKRVINRRA